MNEAGALRRREADEAHRQQDKAIAALASIEEQCRRIQKTNGQLAVSIGQDWLGLVERGLKDAATHQAKESANFVISGLETKVSELSSEVRSALEKTTRLVEVSERIHRAVSWKVICGAGFWLLSTLVAINLVGG